MVGFADVKKRIPSLRGKKKEDSASGSKSGSDSASSASSPSGTTVSKAIRGAKNVGGAVGSRVISGAKTGAKGAKTVATKGGAAVKSKVNAGVDEVLGKIEDGVVDVVDATLDKVADVIKESLKDPLMFDCVKSGIDAGVDQAWPAVKQEVMESVFAGIYKEVPPDAGDAPTWCPNPFAPISAFLLYHQYPYNKTIWGKLRDPMFYLLLVMSVFPYYSISQIFYVLFFILMDKRDEFQLVQFVVAFKATQFFSVGLIPLCVAAVSYYMCATYNNPFSCEIDGPKELAYTMIFFCVQVAFTLFATIILPCSLRKGDKQFKARGGDKKDLANEEGAVTSEQVYRRHKNRKDSNGSDYDSDKDNNDEYINGSECCCCRATCRRGGSLKWFILYDVIIFAIVLALAAIATFATPRTQLEGDVVSDTTYNAQWRLHSTLFMLRILYGLMSFPFLIFNVGPVMTILTHVRPTGYNENGKTVPVMLPRAPAKAVSEEDGGMGGPARKAILRVTNLGDELREKIASLVPGFGKGSSASSS